MAWSGEGSPMKEGDEGITHQVGPDPASARPPASQLLLYLLQMHFHL